MMDKYVEIGTFSGEGFHPVVEYGSWRVAVLNYSQGNSPDELKSVERHIATDEVFVLLGGRAVLFFGDGLNSPDCLFSQTMEYRKTYNVKKSVWHTVALSRDASILVVEDRDTGVGNSDYSLLKREQMDMILEEVFKSNLDR
jgi:hypothetical protein